MKGRALVLPLVMLTASTSAQVPTKCLEIESILVDACVDDITCPGSTEGMNEMVRFITGPQPIALADLQFTFYSSNFLGIAQDATTASLTAQLNASIQGCGHLLEPPGGNIPAGSRVVFITSTAMCVEANSFTALNDTLYVIFQNAGNSQGHFKNNNLVGQAVTTTPDAPLMRWLRIDVGGCGDTATYDANQLVNIYGTFGGSSAENDGATVEFTWPGAPVASYVNFGCQAPFEATVPDIVSADDTLACHATANLQGAVSGVYTSVHWQGGAGSFSAPDAWGTTYAPANGESGDVALFFCAVTNCGDTLCSQTNLFIQPGPQAAFSWTPDTASVSNPTVEFAASASGVSSWAWQFGDPALGYATGPSAAFTFPGSGCYPVILAVGNGSGCTDSLTRVVCVAGSDTLVVPNIFTPNGDGINDVFRVEGGDLASLDVLVFNRWGQLVARMQRTKQVWDGHTPDGEAVPDGTYFYTLRAEAAAGKVIGQSGTITLLR